MIQKIKLLALNLNKVVAVLNLYIKYGYFGFTRSIKSTSDYNPKIPWFTFSAIQYLESFDLSERVIFEYGSGFSTRYWTSRCKWVYTVESDRKWYDKIANDNFLNLNLYFEDNPARFAKSIVDIEIKFDIIVIDAENRMDCAKVAIDCLKDGGIIILDNSERLEEREVCKFLRNSGFFQFDFVGLGMFNTYSWSTSIFLKSQSSLQDNFNQVSLIGGLGDFKK